MKPTAPQGNQRNQACLAVIALQGFTWKTSVKAADALEASVVSVQFTEPVAPAGGFVQGKITRIEQKLRGES